ncbi:MAG: hypothetical protein CSB23_04870, partial [Deltaproteobacteria bacterium]
CIIRFQLFFHKVIKFWREGNIHFVPLLFGLIFFHFQNIPNNNDCQFLLSHLCKKMKIYHTTSGKCPKAFRFVDRCSGCKIAWVWKLIREIDRVPANSFKKRLKECEWKFNGGTPKQLLEDLKSVLKQKYQVSAPRLI